MKKFIFALSMIVFAVVLAACDNRPVLKVYMPTEYIGEDFLDEFNKNSDYRVDIIVFDSNEDMLGKVGSSTYDLIIPSDYAIEELVSKDFLQEIDWTRVTTMAKSDLDSDLMRAIDLLKEDEVSFDILKYAVPYFWGSVGLLFDTTKITRSEIESLGWNVLTQKNRQVMMYDSARDGMMIALKQYYYENNIDRSINNPTDNDLKAAEQWLINLKGSNVEFKTDEVFDNMLNPTKYDVAVTYSGDAVYLMDENDKLDYFVPTTGSNIFIDAVVIPKTTTGEKLDMAYDFISYLSKGENAYANSSESAYTSPRGDVITQIIANGVYPASSYKVVFRDNDELFRYNARLSTSIVTAWQRVLAA